jgi:hypothetical protein
VDQVQASLTVNDATAVSNAVEVTWNDGITNVRII